jgi:hypothetical protein
MRVLGSILFQEQPLPILNAGDILKATTWQAKAPGLLFLIESLQGFHLSRPVLPLPLLADSWSYQR